MRKEIATQLAEFDAPHAEELDAFMETAAQLVQKLMDSQMGPATTDEEKILREYMTLVARSIGEMIGATQLAAFQMAFGLHDLHQMRRRAVTRELRRPVLAPGVVARIVPRQ